MFRRRSPCSLTLPQTSSTSYFSSFFSSLSWPNAAAGLPQTHRQKSQWRRCLAKPNTCSLSFSWLLSPPSVSPLSLHHSHQSDGENASICRSVRRPLLNVLQDPLRYHMCQISARFDGVNVEVIYKLRKKYDSKSLAAFEREQLRGWESASVTVRHLGRIQTQIFKLIFRKIWSLREICVSFKVIHSFTSH